MVLKLSPKKGINARKKLLVGQVQNLRGCIDRAERIREQE